MNAKQAKDRDPVLGRLTVLDTRRVRQLYKKIHGKNALQWTKVYDAQDNLVGNDLDAADFEATKDDKSVGEYQQ